MRHTTTILAIVGISAAAALTGAASASATTTDTEYTTVVWYVPNDSVEANQQVQPYVISAVGIHLVDWKDYFKGLECNTRYQIDVYKHGWEVLKGDTNELLPNRDGVYLAYNIMDKPYDVGRTAACSTTTPTPTPTSTPPVDTSAPTPPTTPPATTPPVVTPTPTASPTPVVTAPASPGSTSTPAPTVQPTAPPTANAQPVGTQKPTPRTADRSDASTHRATSLAYTGSDVNKPLLIGSATLVTGLILLLVARALHLRRTRRAGRTE